MCQAVEDMMESREQIGRQQGELIGRQQGTLETLINLVHKGIISVADAVSEAGVSREVFEEKMQSAQK